jgi:hypothetical protein
MPSWMAWIQRPSGLVKWREAQILLLKESRENGLEGNIDN